MPVEIKILAYAAILLVVHILAAAHVRTREYGLKWNVGPRDEAVPPPGPLSGRLTRAELNFLETLPIAIIALLGVVVAGRTSASTALGGWIWLGARIAYLPLYAAGIPVLRTIAFAIGLVGLAIVLKPLLLP